MSQISLCGKCRNKNPEKLMSAKDAFLGDRAICLECGCTTFSSGGFSKEKSRHVSMLIKSAEKALDEYMFGNAADIYRSILCVKKNLPEALFGMIMVEYGIAFIVGADGKRKPAVTSEKKRSSPITENRYYRKLVKNPALTQDSVRKLDAFVAELEMESRAVEESLKDSVPEGVEDAREKDIDAMIDSIFEKIRVSTSDYTDTSDTGHFEYYRRILEIWKTTDTDLERHGEYRRYMEFLSASAASENEKSGAADEIEIRSGDPESLFKAGEKYYSGTVGEKINYRRAASFFRKAAQMGLPTAQNMLGVCYENGRGVMKCSFLAAKWYRKAAASGLPDAQYNLGVCYKWGRGVKKDAFAAATYFSEAAENGYPAAQCALGDCYSAGEGTERNYDKALFWWKRAADQGYIHAVNILERERELRARREQKGGFPDSGVELSNYPS